jgi:hypothetical protein
VPVAAVNASHERHGGPVAGGAGVEEGYGFAVQRHATRAIAAYQPKDVGVSRVGMYGWARRHGSAGIREQRLEQVRNGCIGFVEGHCPRLRLGLGIARMIVNLLEPLTGELRLRRRPLGRALWQPARGL